MLPVVLVSKYVCNLLRHCGRIISPQLAVIMDVLFAKLTCYLAPTALRCSMCQDSMWSSKFLLKCRYGSLRYTFLISSSMYVGKWKHFYACCVSKMEKILLCTVLYVLCTLSRFSVYIKVVSTPFQFSRVSAMSSSHFPYFFYLVWSCFTGF